MSAATPQTFDDLLEAVQQHYRHYPQHRAGCRCLYPLSRNIARQLTEPETVPDAWVHPSTRGGLADLLVEIARRL